MVTRAILPDSACCMNSLKFIVRGEPDWNLVEKFQIRTPRTMSATQNNRLFNVEFKQSLPAT